MNSLHLISVFSLLFSPISSSPDIDERQMSAYQPGHVIFGGLFPAHLSWREKCADLNMKGIALIEAMMYTVNKVNSENLLPCNLTLGFDVRDTCNTKKSALKSTMSLLSSQHYSSINEDSRSCGLDKSTLCDGKLISIIGSGSTELSVAVNKILSVFDIPQVGYASSSGLLSDKSRFPSFSRTVVVGSNRPQVIVKILSHFGWKHIGLLVSDDSHWKSLALEFKNLASSNGICIAIDELLSEDTKIIESVVSQVNSSKNTHIMVLFASILDVKNVIKQASDINLRGKVWINTEMLPPDVVTNHADTMQGMIVIEREPETVNEFSKYFTSLTPSRNAWNPWFKTLWEKMFNCRLSKSAEVDHDKRACSGKEKFGWISQVLSFSNTMHVIDAVMAATHVIKNICEEMKSVNASQARDQCLNKLTKDNILKQMFKGPFVFQSLFNRTVSLDKNGNVIGSYIVFNLKQGYNGMRFYEAGLYKSYEDKLNINNDIIRLPKEFHRPLVSCVTLCEPGYYKQFEGSKCCWTCKICAIGTFSTKSNADKCIACPHDSTSNRKKTSCKKKLSKYFDWGSSGGVTLTTISLISFVLSLIIFCVLLKYKTSAVVSGWGSDVNFYLLCSISIGVLTPFAFIGYPTNVMCKLQAIIVPTTLTLSLSLVLVKIRQISCKKKNMISRWQVLSYAQKQTIYALFLTFVEMLFCILWVIISPPDVSIRSNNAQEKIIVCTNQNSSWYVLSFFYIFIITLLITLRSCKARHRSFNFSEAKYILYAMVCIYIMWGVYIAVFFGTSFGFHHTTLLCLTTIATQMIILGFIFIPKIFILFWKPEMGKISEFQMDDIYAKMSYEASNPRHLHPNGIQRSRSRLSFRDDVSSMGSPSHLSLDLNPTIYPHVRTQSSEPRNIQSLVARLAQLPCCTGFLPNDGSTQSVESDQLRPTPRRLPLIMIDEGTRSNSTIGQISDRTLTPKSPHCSRRVEEQDSVSATMDDTSEVWDKRRRTPNHDNNRAGELNNEEYSLRYALNGKGLESKRHHVKDNSMRESRL